MTVQRTLSRLQVLKNKIANTSGDSVVIHHSVSSRSTSMVSRKGDIAPMNQRTEALGLLQTGETSSHETRKEIGLSKVDSLRSSQVTELEVV